MKRPEKIEYVIRTGGEGGELQGVRVHGYPESDIDKYIDYLEDKLEDFDRLQMDFHHLEKYGKINETKLEAVKTWKQGMFLKMPFIGDMGHISKHDLDRLDKILEGED